MTILVSACLLACPCRYDGQSKPCPGIDRLRARHTLIPFCPEIYGGLPTPRPPSERLGDRVVNDRGQDVTAAYERGAREALRLVRLFGCGAAVLKSRSPPCGKGQIYDGSFSRALIPGNGVTAALLLENGVPVYTEDELEELP